MKKVLLFSITAVCLLSRLHAQITCNAASFDVDLSASLDSTVSFQSTRNGDCCSGNNCIRFNLKLNPACSYVNFTVQNPAPPGNAAYYQIDCGTPTSLGTPICIVGKTDVVITFCKPGNDNPIYTITAAGALKGSDDITVREGCTGSMNVAGLQAATINWTSIYPGAPGAYNSWLNCTSACASVNVTPQTGAPAYVDYKVSGFRLCGPLVNDTIRVYTTPQIGLSITPNNVSVCAGGSTSVTLTATASGGDEPYNFIWNGGQTGPSITVNTGNTYSVSVTDARNCLPATASVVVTTTPLPVAPALSSNSPVCEGTTLQLNAATVAGAIYSWTGPNGFTSSQQNPVIPSITSSNAGVYFVTITVGQCTSLPASTSVVVNSIPVTPVVSNNTPVCEGGTLNLSAGNIPTAVYSWTGPNGFLSSVQNPSINNVNLSAAGTYSVTAKVNGCTSLPASTAVIINALPAAPLLSSNGPVCAGNDLVLNAGTINNAAYSWTGPNGFSSSTQNPVINNAALNASGTYTVKATLNGCTGPSSSLAVVVNPIPAAPVLSSNAPFCEGTALALSASAAPGAVYSWTGPNGFTSSLQNPVLANTSALNSGIYSAFLTVNGCSSSINNTTVLVKPIPASPSVSGNTVVCEETAISLSAAPIAGTSYSWSGPNNFSSANSSFSIVNAASSNSGTYSVTTTLNGCTSAPAVANVIVNNRPIAPSINLPLAACSGTSVSLNVASLPGASYSWTGPNGFTSSLQNPVITAVSLSNAGTYYLAVTVNGCLSAVPSSADLVVNTTPSAPLVINNGPLCEGKDLLLSASGIPGASYSWTGPNGFSSNLQNSLLTSVALKAGGNYYATATVNGCTGPAAATTVLVDQQAIVSAGNDQIICTSTPSVNLSATITGNQKTGIWSTLGTGTFSNGASPVTSYSPSVVDKTAGSVVLYLTSTNNGACPSASAGLTIRFTPLPSATAGPDVTVCANDAKVALSAAFTNASGGLWTTSGAGSFTPSANAPNAVYLPGIRDKTEGSAKLAWTTIGNGACPAASDEMVISIKQPPSVNTGATQTVLENNSVVLKPVVTGARLSYNWSPTTFLDKDTVRNPLCSPLQSITYKLSVQDEFGCTASGDLTVKLIRNPVIPNVFTPNGDGINDTWQVKNLPEYNDCVLNIYNRYGQVVYKSAGYNKEWDGSANGRPLPAGTYYYIIDLKTGAKPLSGFVDIVR